MSAPEYRYERRRPLPEGGRDEILRQVGRANLLAISGGRYYTEYDRVTLPVAHGYDVEIQYDWDDTYVVRRLFRRAGKTWLHGEWANVYADQVGDVAYEASLYHDRVTP